MSMEIQIKCPFCRKKGIINVNVELLVEAGKSDIAINVPPGAGCPHAFRVIMDRNGDVIGYDMKKSSIKIKTASTVKRVEEIRMQGKSKHIAKLADPDRVALGDLEAILKNTIPHTPGIDITDFEYKARNGHITSLALNNCNLTELPDSVGNLYHLRTLDLSLNELDSLPHSFGQLVALEELNLVFNQFHTVPEEVCQLEHLRSLDLSNNQLDTLPDGIGTLKSLQELFLNGNKLSALPAGVWSLPLLETLDLSDNNFCALPEAVKHLKSLDILELQGNHFPSLPDTLLLLPALRVFRIDSYLATCTLIQELKKKKVGISVRKPSAREEAILALQVQPLISQDKILTKLSSEPIHIQELISKLEIKEMAVARSLQIELGKLEASKKIFVLQKEGREFYCLKESINND